MPRVVRAFCVLALAACGGSAGDGGDPAADASTGGGRADAAVIERADARADGCLPQVPEDWGTASPIHESNYCYQGDCTFFGDLVPDTERMQRLFISLHAEMGVFSGPVEPGTYVLEGEETDYAWCGACVYLAVDDDGNAPSVIYMAQTGKLTVDSVAGGEIHGVLESATLVEIEKNANGPSCADYQKGDPWPCGNAACLGSNQLCETQELVPECTTSIDSLEF